MIIPLLFLLASSLCGIAALASLKIGSEKTELALLGTVTGLTTITSLTYAITRLTGLHQSIIVAITVVLGLIVLTIAKPATEHWRKLLLDKIFLLTLIATLILFATLAPKVLIRQEDGLYTGVYHAYGDIGWHLATTTSLQYHTTLIPENPSFAGEPLAYPFMPNFLSATLAASGSHYPEALSLPAMIFLPALATLLFILTSRLTSSHRAAAIATILFLGAGATVGWINTVHDWQGSGQPLLEFITHLNQNYSGYSTDPQSLFLPSPVYALLLPQRSLMFGMAIVLAITLLIIRSSQPRHNFAIAGLLAGILPFFHTHSAIALAAILLALFLHKPRAPWPLFVTVAIITGVPAILYYTTNVAGVSRFARWHPLWLTTASQAVQFWLKNTGLILPIIFIGLALRPPRLLMTVTLAGLALFLLANLFAFAPWLWDNTKILVYWLLFAAPILGFAAARAWQHSPLLRTIAIILIAAHIASGTIDLWQVALPTKGPWLEWTNIDQATAAMIRQHTAPNSSILAYPTFNSPVALSGRPLYLGYSAHVWSHGGSPWQREDAITPFYNGQRSNLPEHTPDYILISPRERQAYPALQINPNWHLVATTNHAKLYQP